MTEEDPGVRIAWTRGEATVRWHSPAGSVEKRYEQPPQSVMAWREYDEVLVLMVEAVNGAPFTPSDNAVVYRPDGTEQFRLHPPHGLLPEASDVCTASTTRSRRTDDRF
ncbi:hypothetical protein ACFWWA_31290 [Streptomyces goshikiensis]|uniref:hypothetical protein n=1 Tax=Streptomyces goshikiensis TaxID=1942 RepID=UPI00365EEFBA